MTAPMTPDELRELDRDIAIFLGWEYYPDGDYRWLSPDCLPANDCPAYSSTWEGLQMLIAECDRCEWEYDASSKPREGWVYVSINPEPELPASTPRLARGSTLPMAFALAFRKAKRDHVIPTDRAPWTCEGCGTQWEQMSTVGFGGCPRCPEGSC